jgi:hypothetical protein
MATCCPEVIASLEQQLENKGVALDRSMVRRWTLEAHYLQGVRDRRAMKAILRLNSVIVRLRLLQTKGLTFNDTVDMVKYGAQLYFNEKLRGTRPTTTRLERKSPRLKPPARRRGFVLYRCVGAARRQGAM